MSDHRFPSISWSVTQTPSPQSRGAAAMGDLADSMPDALEAIRDAVDAAPEGVTVIGVLVVAPSVPDDAA